MEKELHRHSSSNSRSNNGNDIGCDRRTSGDDENILRTIGDTVVTTKGIVPLSSSSHMTVAKNCASSQHDCRENQQQQQHKLKKEANLIANTQ